MARTILAERLKIDGRPVEKHSLTKNKQSRRRYNRPSLESGALMQLGRLAVALQTVEQSMRHHLICTH
jgi:hypothetical protein